MPTTHHEDEDEPPVEPVEAVQEYHVEFKIAKRRRVKAAHPSRQGTPCPTSWVRSLGRALWWAVETAAARWGGR